jgi:ankyrin repeat protein
LICFWFLSEYKEIKKISPKFYDDEDDVYWKEKVATLPNRKKPYDMTYRAFYETIFYREYIWKHADGLSAGGLLDKMFQDEIFLTRYINIENIYGATALMYCAGIGNYEYLKKLLSAGADVNAQNTKGQTALMSATCSRYFNIEIFKLLLEYKVDVNIQDTRGYTALIFATQYSLEEKVFKLLLNAGANVNLYDYTRHTALSCASMSNKVGIIKMLLDAGADINFQHKGGCTPLMLAALHSNEETIKFLLDAGANPDLTDVNNKKAIDYARNDTNRALLSK